ncbi:MAG: hypothetical protein MJY45_02855 [Bacteroidales bacterium]|nr:hypothetical protein [Bacteroidales bacterium]
MSDCRARTRVIGRSPARWESEPGLNLTFSVLLDFSESPLPLEASDSILLTEIATFAIRRFLTDENIDSRIKLPNDIYVGGRKICGILIENKLSGRMVARSIIGAGLNLNQTSFPPELPNPVSAAMLTGRKYDTDTALRCLETNFREAWILACSMEGREILKESFVSAIGINGNEESR